MIANELRAARKSLGLTQHGLADALGMGTWGFQSIGKWENGKVPIPDTVAVTIGLLLKAALRGTGCEREGV